MKLTFYTSFLYTGVALVAGLQRRYYIMCAVYLLAMLSLNCHARAVPRTFDTIADRLCVYAVTLLFIIQYGRYVCTWVAIVYMICAYAVSCHYYYREPNVRLQQYVHASFHIVTAATMAYVICRGKWDISQTQQSCRIDN